MQRWDIDEDTQSCLKCGSHVTPEFRRGYGDEDNRAHRCVNCDTYTRISSGSAAGKDVEVEKDPLEDPTRFNETRQNLDESVREQLITDGGGHEPQS